MKRLYILESIKGWGMYDSAHAFIIRATDAKSARRMASMEAGDEGHNVWLNPKKTSCKILTASGKTKVILRDFNAG